MVPILCTITIMIISLGYTVWTLSSPERMKFFNYVMFIPAPIAFLFFFYETKSFSTIIKPIISIPSISSLTFSALFPVLFLSLIALIVVGVGLGELTSNNFFKVLDQLPTGKGLLFALFVLIGEEYAWRGYLLPRFSEMWGPILATVAIGIIWAVWHGPLVYGLASKLGTSSSPLLLCFLQMGAVFVLSFPFAYVYFKSGSILPPVVFHFVWNWLNPAILGNVYRNRPGLVKGDLLLINGETTAGVVLGLFFIAWFVLYGVKPFLPNKL